MTEFYPTAGGPAKGDDLPPVAYLQWYIPRLREQRKHNLSFSGLQFPWELDEVEDVWRDHRKPGYDERSLVATMYDVPVENVHLAMGATQAISLAIAAASRGGKVAVEMPSYGPVSQTARILGLETIEVNRLPTSEVWTIDRGNWEVVLAEVDLLMISPQLNPVGCTYTEDDRKWLVEKCKEMDVRIISDEVYSASDRNWKPFFKDGGHCISISSLTKVHGLGVIRYGWILASEDTIQNVNKAFHNMEGMMASPTIRIAEKVRPKLHEPIDLIEEYRKRNIPVLQKALEGLGISWVPPKHGVFGAFRIEGVDTLEMIDTIGKDLDLLAVPGCMFDSGLTEWLRVGWSIEPKHFAEAISVLEEVIRRALNIT